MPLASKVVEATGDAPVPVPATEPIAPPPGGELERLRLEVVELRHRVATAEALLAAERRLGEELSAGAAGRAPHRRRAPRNRCRAPPRAPGGRAQAVTPARAPQPRPNWQAELRALGARELQARAAREREEQARATGGDDGK